MIDAETLIVLLMVLGVLASLLSGFHVGLTLAGAALIAGFIGVTSGMIPEAILKTYPSRIIGAMQNNTFIAIPLFVFMGLVLEKSKLAEDLLQSSAYLMAKVRGGLALSVIIVGALLAASTGIIGATVVTMTLIALPVMLDAGYDEEISTGTIAAAGSLGQIIPPSIVLILLADAISNATQSVTSANMETTLVVSVGDLFAAAIVPGILLMVIYVLYILALSYLRPDRIPMRKETNNNTSYGLVDLTINFATPLLLIIFVLGAILVGLASPTEASACGAIGAILLAAFKISHEQNRKFDLAIISLSVFAAVCLAILNFSFDLRLAAFRHETSLPIFLALFILSILTFGIGYAVLIFRRSGYLTSVNNKSVKITAMIFLILLGASMFSLVFRAFGGDEIIGSLLTNIPGGMYGALTVSLFAMFILGFFMDYIEITFVVIPLVTPPLLLLGADPLWVGILMALVLQTSFLTPPFGFALFYVRGVAPMEVKTSHIWKGALPFVILQILLIIIILLMPGLSTWLPSLIGKT